ncbi:glycerol-3-phosphate responsive antiterminator [Paenibacillus hexagrammi]|uniref:Glycerol uptake operon antiterminator regulatory protein n=1 Tax=Paenibacillus hexagrammi TaxID=2908839 RepID=A0ABY3SE40_9BACL|nr:glycerol-3-phosphate responsive antiterminator [Paenibacillus sp. YPD9-1]UJF32186.1 glycerol-3-phosphate responsive antiterminator [Paenibacillus sp. YPD9-1]
MTSYPIIASVTREEQIPSVLGSSVQRVNLMAGHIGNLGSIIEQIHQSGKMVYVHLEMVSGLGRDSHTVEFLARQFRADGIVTTKSNAVAAARQAGIRSIQRIFAIDTAAVQTAVRMIASAQPDEVELMPGLMPRVIKELKATIKQPLIVGGLIRYEDEIVSALSSGADFISSGDPSMWHYAEDARQLLQNR